MAYPKKVIVTTKRPGQGHKRESFTGMYARDAARQHLNRFLNEEFKLKNAEAANDIFTAPSKFEFAIEYEK